MVTRSMMVTRSLMVARPLMVTRSLMVIRRRILPSMTRHKKLPLDVNITHLASRFGRVHICSQVSHPRPQVSVGVRVVQDRVDGAADGGVDRVVVRAVPVPVDVLLARDVLAQRADLLELVVHLAVVPLLAPARSA